MAIEGPVSIVGRESSAWLTIPNFLTALRLLSIVPFVVWASQGKDDQALALFLLAGLTDTLDGTIARRLGQQSKIGRLFDPLVDKLFTGAAFIVLSAFRSGLTRIPTWVMIAVLLRDALILLGSLLVYSTSKVTSFKPSVWGKLNTFVEIGLVVLFLAQFQLPWIAIALPFLYIVLLLSLIVSGGDYVKAGIHMLNSAAPSSR